MQDIKKLELMSASVPMFIKLLNENEEVLLFYDIIIMYCCVNFENKDIFL